MSQIDVLNFITNLFWFVLALVVIYFAVFTYFLPMVMVVLNVRDFFLWCLTDPVILTYIIDLIIILTQDELLLPRLILIIIKHLDAKTISKWIKIFFYGMDSESNEGSYRNKNLSDLRNLKKE